MTRPRTASSRIQLFAGAFLAFYLACSVLAGIFAFSKPISSFFFRIDPFINHKLHIPQTDLVWGYWALFLPAAGLAVCLWLGLRFAISDKQSIDCYRLIGILALYAAPAYWLWATYIGSHRYGWTPIRAYQFYELILAMAITLILAKVDKHAWRWLIGLTVCFHFSFWTWQFGSLYFLQGNPGPIALLPVIGLIATLLWLLGQPTNSEQSAVLQ